LKKSLIRSSIFFVVFLLTLSSFFPGVHAQSPSTQSTELNKAKIYGEIDTTSDKQTTVMIELKEQSMAEAKQKGKKQTKTALKKARTTAKSKAEKSVKNGKVNREYEQVFSGFSMKLPASEIPKLLAIEEIKAVYPNVTYTTDDVKGKEAPVPQDAVGPQMDKSAPYIGAVKAWESGYTGEGVTVAIIDTGVDYTHPDLKNNFGAYKGYDFVDNDYSPQETPAGDPRGEATQHGSHVAGTVAANGTIKGVAPDATLLAYRVLGPGGTGTTENVVAGIERAVTDGADVMNLSLGNSVNNPDWATSIALDWAMSEGVTSVTSNGNSGPDNWTVGSPGTSREAISVGATQLPYTEYGVDFAPYSSAKVMGYNNEEDIQAINNKDVELVFAGIGDKSDFEGIDVTGKIAVVQRGVLPFVDKSDNAKAAGAIGVVVYNNVPGEIAPNVPGISLPTIKLSKEDGEALVGSMNQGNTTARFSFTVERELGELMADFSSRGPVMDTWMIKPDISAPGVNIVSTVPTHDPANPYGYASMQGTSMASPHVAGAVAVLKEVKPDWTPGQLKAALMNTADKLTDADGHVYPHNTQGAGSVRIVDAIEAKTIISPASYSFGTYMKDRGKQTKKHSFTIENLSKSRKAYTLEYSFDGAEKNGIKIKGTTERLVIPANKKGKAHMSVQVDAKKAKAGTYEGKILVREGGSLVAEIPTLLIVKEPDYPRVTSVEVLPGSTEGSYVIEAYYPGGAEETAFLVYDAEFNFVGEAGIYKQVGKGYQTFNWDGKINGAENLAAGEYYLLAYAIKSGKSSQVLTEEPFIVE
jgi:minor extracellular serine protease Vpr